MTVWLARHGETAYNAERRFQGQGAVPLSERGREQARELAERAADLGIASLWCSPLPRARQTADIVAGHLGLHPRDEPRLMETDAGDWADCLFSEIEAVDPQRFAAFIGCDPGFAFPGGESFAAQQERVCAALDEIRAAGPLPALVVCHRNAMRLALERVHGRRLSLDDVPNGALVEL